MSWSIGWSTSRASSLDRLQFLYRPSAVVWCVRSQPPPLSAALVNYRVAHLELQLGAGLLQVDEEGMWREYKPGEGDDAEQNDDGE